MSDQKIKDDDYRAAVMQWCSGAPMKSLDQHTTIVPVSITPTADVHRTFGGAFVEMHVWVPDVAVEPQR